VKKGVHGTSQKGNSAFFSIPDAHGTCGGARIILGFIYDHWLGEGTFIGDGWEVVSGGWFAEHFEGHVRGHFEGAFERGLKEVSKVAT
jgi:hypothetical protein